MIKELFSSTKGAYLDRVQSPILGTLAIGWFIFNWRIPVLILLRDSPISETFAYIDSNHIGWCPNVIFPLIFATVFLLLYPLLTFLYFKYQSKSDSAKRTSKLENELPILIAQTKLTEAQSEIDEIKGKAALNAEGRRIQLQADQDRMNRTEETRQNRDMKNLEWEYEEQRQKALWKHESEKRKIELQDERDRRMDQYHHEQDLARAIENKELTKLKAENEVLRKQLNIQKLSEADQSKQNKKSEQSAASDQIGA